jgi:DNA-binding NtrC family response regulator
MNMAKTVLLVDDDDNLLDSVAEVLRTRGYFMLEHSDPREALEACFPKEEEDSSDFSEMDMLEIRRIHPTVEELLMTGNLRWWGPPSDDTDFVEESFSYAALFQADEDTMVS